MKCENIQFNLPIYFDNALSDGERKIIDEHLPACPLCRQKLSEHRELRNEMRMMKPTSMPENILSMVRNAVDSEINAPIIQLVTEKKESYLDKLTYWLMPYSVGTVTALALSFALFSTLSTTKISTNSLVARDNLSNTSVMLANSNATNVRKELSLPSDYTSVALGVDTPRVNPKGALFALAKSIVRGEMGDDEVVLVADVFRSGRARITEIIKAPNDERGMRELEKAFQTDPQKVPFLPPTLETNYNAVRMVLKIQPIEILIIDATEGDSL